MSQPPATPPSTPSEPSPGVGGPAPATGASGSRAGFWTRFAAALIDGVLVGIVVGILGMGVDTGAANLLGILVAVAYYGYLEGSASGQTVGKRALNIRVIDFGTGGPLGYGKAVLRYFARYISAVVVLLGYLWMLWDKEKQTWHDKIAATVVVPTSAYPVENWPG